MDKVLKIIEGFNNLIIPFGVIIGGIWAYRKYFKRAEYQWNANLKIHPEILKENVNENIILVNVSIENIGNHVITPTSKGLRVQIWKSVKTNAENVIINDWEQLKEIDADILSDYKIYNKSDENKISDYSNCWNLDSGATYNEKFIMKLKDKGLYKIMCRLYIVDKIADGEENTITEYTFILLNK